MFSIAAYPVCWSSMGFITFNPLPHCTNSIEAKSSYRFACWVIFHAFVVVC